MITALVTGLGSVLGPLLSELVPDTDRRNELQAQLDAQLTGLVRDVSTAQLDINRVEAAHPSIFVAGWRPAIGWICAFGLFWASGGLALVNWFMALICILAGLPDPPVIPEFDLSFLEPMIYAMLGMGGLRTFEKMKGVARR